MIEYLWRYPIRPKNWEDIFLGENVYPQIQSILISRGIDTEEKLNAFRKPHQSQFHSPWLMKDMDKAVGRVLLALENHQKILVYGDYDVDGTTAIALVYSFLKDRNADVDFYVPDRYTEGYGVSEKGIQYAIENNFQLIITLDCGIKAIKTVAMAQCAGVDVIVCDHHNQGDDLPNAYAVLDPKRHDCEYPFKELSGCGVGFKLLHALCEKLNLPTKDNLFCYLDYLAISTAADIVPIVDENRVYMYYGLMKMVQKPLMSVKTMLLYNKLIYYSKNENDEIKLVANNPLTVSDIVFKIAPKINAAGRMQNARDAINLLLAKTEEEAQQYFSTVRTQNSERQGIEKEICDEAFEMLRYDPNTCNLCTNVLYKGSWHKGVVGIAAAKIIEQYYKPTIILCGEGDIISGSARSVEGFDLYSAIDKCSKHLTAFGGHKHAAGLSMKKENFENFKADFEQAVKESILEEQKRPTICIDELITLDEINNDFYRQLQFIAPFGPENMDPVFVIENVKAESVLYMGNDKQHLKLFFRDSQNREIAAVGWGMAEKWKNLNAEKKAIDICFTICTNVFRGVTSIQLQLKDVRTHI